MKTTIAIFLMLCLQVAMSSLCLCYVSETRQDVAKPSCCHVPAGEEQAPCPHCDQEMPIAATAPENGDFSADPPEWHGFDQFIAIVLFDAIRASVVESHKCDEPHDYEPPPQAFSEKYGVFLI